MPFQRFVPTLLVDDVATVARFYVETVGFRVTSDVGWFVSLAPADGRRDDQELCLLDRQHDATPAVLRDRAPGLVLAFVVDDAAAAEDRLLAAGVPVALTLRDEPWGQRRCLTLDPAGIGVEFVQVTAPDPEWLAAQTATGSG